MRALEARVRASAITRARQRHSRAHADVSSGRLQATAPGSEDQRHVDAGVAMVDGDVDPNAKTYSFSTTSIAGTETVGGGPAVAASGLPLVDATISVLPLAVTDVWRIAFSWVFSSLGLPHVSQTGRGRPGERASWYANVIGV